MYVLKYALTVNFMLYYFTGCHDDTLCCDVRKRTIRMKERSTDQSVLFAR